MFWMWVIISGDGNVFRRKFVGQLYKEKGIKMDSFVAARHGIWRAALGMRWMGVLFPLFLLFA